MGLDLYSVARPWYQSWHRFLLSFSVLALYVILCRASAAALGLRLRPVQGFGYWTRIALWLGAIVVVFSLLSFLLLSWGFGIHLPLTSMFHHEAYMWSWLFSACLIAPLMEEALYRLVLCPPSLALGSRWLPVVVSGALFGLLHFRYGNPGPDNFVAGYLLAWAFLKSEPILVPILLHSAGNLAVFCFHWYLFYWPVI
jgi:uncharacterized protein